MAKNRMFALLLTLAAAFALLAARLLWLQTAGALAADKQERPFVQRAVEQRRQSVVLDDGRGRIVDRFGAPLAGVACKGLLVLPAEEQERGLNEQQVGQVAAALGIRPQEWRAFAAGRRQPALWKGAGEREPGALSGAQEAALRAVGSPLLKVVPFVRRYAPQSLAAPLIGYTGQNPDLQRSIYGELAPQGRVSAAEPLGVAGLERTFERFLRGTTRERYVRYNDGRSNPVAGLGERVVADDNPFYPLQVVTTLDSGLQRRIEAMMDELALADATIVVLDAGNADVLAIGDRPLFDPGSVDPQQGLWHSGALRAEPPGSIFKTVVAAAALETGIAKRYRRSAYTCRGEANIGGARLRCRAATEHGRLSLEQAYAQSCNVTFAALAVELGAQRLTDAAERLALTRPAGWTAEELRTPYGLQRPFAQLDGESGGQLFAAGTNRDDPGVLAQTGIGQRDVRMSPLQAANLAVTIVNGGIVREPRIVTEVRHRHQRTLVRFDEHARQGIAPATAAWLKRAMRQTVQTGTARRLAQAAGGVAGKTGTAELKPHDPGREHHWFIGFAPAERPLYAFAVLVRRSPAGGGHKALQAADKLLDILNGG